MKKTNTQNILIRPFHLHVEYFFRKRFCLLAVLILMGIALIKSDGKFLGLMRDAYSYGYGVVGAYIREEPIRTPLSVGIARTTAIASK